MALPGVGSSELDVKLHRAIDLLQVIVFDLESLKQQPEIVGTNLDKELETLTEHVFQCSDLLHEVRQTYRDSSENPYLMA
jgi:hypothetical protein